MTLIYGGMLVFKFRTWDRRNRTAYILTVILNYLPISFMLVRSMMSGS